MYAIRKTTRNLHHIFTLVCQDHIRDRKGNIEGEISVLDNTYTEWCDDHERPGLHAPNRNDMIWSGQPALHTASDPNARAAARMTQGHRVCHRDSPGSLIAVATHHPRQVHYLMHIAHI